MVLIALGYWIALQFFHDSFRTVIQVLGVFNLIYLATCAFYTWVWPASRSPEKQDSLLTGSEVL